MNRTVAPSILAFLCLTACPTPEPRDAGRTDTPMPDGPMFGDTPIPPTDGRSDVPMGTGCRVGPSGCDVLAQDCPPEGMVTQGCYLNNDMGTLSTMCFPSGALGEGMPCTMGNDCAEGLICQDMVCRDLCCTGSDDACRVGYRCRPYGGSMGETLPVGVCTPPAMCMVIPNSGCPMGAACWPTEDGGRECFMAGTATEGMPCGGMTGQNCVPGFGCFGTGAGTPASCFQFCELASPMCSSGRTCRAAPSVVGGGFGLCQPM